MNTSIKSLLHSALLVFLLALASDSRGWSQSYDVLIDGQRRGYASIVYEPLRGYFLQRQTLEVVQLRKRIRMERQLRIQRNASGELQSVHVEERAGQQRRSWQGTVSQRVMRWRSTGGREVELLLRWDHALLLADTQLLALHLLHSTDAAEQVRSFDPVAGAYRQWRAQLLSTADGLRDYAVFESGLLPDDRQYVQLDAQGRLLQQSLQRAGLEVQWRACQHDCERPIEHPLDLLDQQSLRSPFHIPKSALAGPIRYVLSRSDGELPQLEATPEQALVRNGNRLVVTICDDCGEPVSLSDEDRARYLSPNAWVRSDDVQVRRLARRAGGARHSAHARMRKLEQLVARALPVIDMLGYKDAATALAQGSGDCTETAILLAAAARAQGIPTRVVAGLVYSDRFSGRRDVFAPHYWVQAWIDDRWVSYDAGVMGFDATHIALGVGDGDPAQTIERTRQLGHLRIEQMGQLPAGGGK